MATGTLTIDLDALAANWRALNSKSDSAVETGAVVKADGYGLGAARVARALARAGAQTFFVAAAEEGAAVREALGRNAEIYVFGGHMAGDTDMIHDLDLIPLLNSINQLTRHIEALPGAPFGLQLDSGMNRLGLEPAEWSAVRDLALSLSPRLIMSHLASADEPDSAQNGDQLRQFLEMTDGTSARRSLSATGGTLLGPQYHFDLTRPGIGLYGGLPFAEAKPVARVSLPVIQTRLVAPGEVVGYNATWTAPEERLIATVAGGYADGLLRALSGTGQLWHDGVSCPIVGRVSMDLITVDISSLSEIPQAMDILCPEQGVDDVASAAGTIGYEVLTSLGGRYERKTIGGLA